MPLGEFSIVDAGAGARGSAMRRQTMRGEERAQTPDAGGNRRLADFE
jgi:hypothetical protein